tara:strand:- start:8503 stop:10224 length:1722 start_codon:yes stop_codon:yes gene_type:complete
MFQPKSESVQVGVQSVIIPCRNGTNFSGESQLYFDIPRNIGFANLKNARILTSIKLDNTPGSLCAPYIPDRITGAQCFIKRCTIRSNGVVLEELNNYNLYAKLHHSASWDAGVENKRTRLEGCMKSNRIQDSVYHVPNQATADNTDTPNCFVNIDRQVEIPILGGIFQNPKAFPLMAMPLEVELILARAVEVMGIPDGLGGDAGLPCDVTGGATLDAVVTAANAAQWGPIGTGNELSPDPNNNIVSCCPFRIGQIVRFTCDGPNTNLDAAAVGGTPITNIKSNAGVFTISCAAYATGITGTNVAIHSLGGADGGGLTVQSAGFILQPAGPNPPVSPMNYVWKNPRLLIPKVVPPPQFAQAMAKAIQKGKYSIDCLSYIDYMTAISGSITNSTSIIPADLSRVKAILSVPIDQQNVDRADTRNGLTGLYGGAENYIYQINNILQPDRNVNVRRENDGQPANQATWGVTRASAPWSQGSNISGIHIYELEKALQSAGIAVRNLNFITKPASLNGCWALGRSLGPYGTSTSLMNVSAILYLNYDPAIYNSNLKLLHNFVAHIRTLEITPGGTVVRY